MQHKVSGSWNSGHDTECLTMAEDGIEEVNCMTLTNAISSSSDSTVSTLTRTAGSISGGAICLGAMAGGLEQKIQELRAGKETIEFNKCSSPIVNDQDIPIDFSVKRRTSFSGSLTDDSQTSSSSPGHMTDYNTMSPSAEPVCVHDSIRFSKRDTPSPDDLHRRVHGQTKMGIPLLTMPPLLNSLGFAPSITSNLLSNGSAMNSFSHIAAAAIKESRNKKNNRPFKAYPKEALQTPLGFFGIPGITSAALQQGMDLSLLMGMTNEDLVNLYHQQIQLVRDNKFSGQGVKVPTSSSSKQIHHHYQQQSQYPNLSSPATNISSISPSLTTSDHLKTGASPSSTTFHGSSTSGSLNTTLVSSTSSFALSNSRKRASSFPDEQKDAAYWERRRKNNDAAKRSRDARRAKEDEIAMRAALLEQENLKLRVEVAALKTETERLRCMLYSN